MNDSKIFSSRVPRKRDRERTMKEVKLVMWSSRLYRGIGDDSGYEVMALEPLGSRRQKANWRVLIEADGSGLLTTESGTSIKLPKNS